MEGKPKAPKVAVIGLGLSGIGALKNFREVGLDAVGFERNSYIGGLWQFSPNQSQTTILQSTIANISKQRNSFTDFPFPDDVPDYPTADQIARYIDDYADRFGLREHCRLSTRVERIERSSDGLAWRLKFKNHRSDVQSELFDKVLITTGTYSKPFIPIWEGADDFKGRILHSQAFKNPSDYANQRVVVVGLSNTGGDAAVELSKVAAKVYLSHRSGARLLKRRANGGPPADHMGTRRLSGIAISMARRAPQLSGKLGALALERRMKTDPGYRADFRLLPAGPISHTSPVANDHLLDLLADGSLASVAGIRRFRADGTTVELDDGTELTDIDAVVCCTGYRYDYSAVSGAEADPTAHPTPEWDAAPHNNSTTYPRLYMGLFSPAYTESLAFMGAYRGHSPSAFCGVDLIGQAIAQVWSGGYPLPDRAERERWCDRQYRYLLGQVATWHIHKPAVPPGELEAWLNEVAGNGMRENLGWGWQAWKFWWSDRELYKMIMDGIDTSFVYRLFDGRRKKWDGAREAIMRTNGKDQ